MKEYGKTENLFKRDPDTHKLIEGELRDEAWGQIGGWLATEKVDGTNIRVLLRLSTEPIFSPDGIADFTVEVRGRSDNANLPSGLEAWIKARIEARKDRVLGWLHQLTGSDPYVVVCLYGEGFGPGIQKVGTLYGGEKRLVIFDVTTTRLELPYESQSRGLQEGKTWWRSWQDVNEAAVATGIETVPFVGTSVGLAALVNYVKGAPSLVNIDAPLEGIVARTNPYLYDHRGARVMFKLKGHDLA